MHYIQADAVMAKFDGDGDGKLDYQVNLILTFEMLRIIFLLQTVEQTVENLKKCRFFSKTSNLNFVIAPKSTCQSFTV